MKNYSGVIRNPPPTPNMPDSKPTPPPTANSVNALVEISAMGRYINMISHKTKPQRFTGALLFYFGLAYSKFAMTSALLDVGFATGTRRDGFADETGQDNDRQNIG